MELIEQKFEIVNAMSYEAALETVTSAASTCYKSSPKDMERFVKSLIKSGHTSTIEHVSITFRLITDRAVTHELVRHRIASYSQESQRYCAYRDNVKFVIPHWVDVEPGVYSSDKMPALTSKEAAVWLDSIMNAEMDYKSLLEMGVKPQDARTVLPNSCATEIVCTFNFRSLMNFFQLRADKAAHPDIRRFALEFLKFMARLYPAFFEHLLPKTDWREQVKKALDKCDLKYDEHDINMILGTAAVESDYFKYDRQLGGGPALGYFQCEPRTRKDIVENYLKYRPRLVKQLEKGLGTSVKMSDSAFVKNFDAQVVFCYLHYRRFNALRAETLLEYAAAWKKVYNTKWGKGTTMDYMEKYRRYVDADN